MYAIKGHKNCINLLNFNIDVLSEFGCLTFLFAPDSQNRELRIHCSQGRNCVLKAEKAPLHQAFQLFDCTLLMPPPGNCLAQLNFYPLVGRLANPVFELVDAGQ